MTEGSIPRLLIVFALPLMIGNIFQQLYNTVDSIIVGNFVSRQALAAVGCTGPIINTLIGVFGGLASGAGVVISQYYGAKDRERLHSAVQTTIALTLVMCAALTALGVAMTPFMLRLMATPEDVIGEASTYLSLYFWGISGMLLYNIGAGILRAVGDSTHPLYFLIFSATTNTILDYLFVKVFSWGIAGAAIATVVSQFLSALLVLRMLIVSRADYRIDLRAIGFDRAILRRICAIGVPSSLQMGVTAVSNVFVQSYINRFESSCMAGWAAYNKLDAFAFLPLLGFSMAVTTFVGQNYGAGKLDRARKGPLYALGIGTVLMIVILTPMMIFAPSLVKLFNQEAEVVAFGTLFIRLISPFYLLCTINQVYSGALRGVGDTKATMVIMLFSFVLFRQLYLFTAYRLGGGIVPIALGYPSGWVMCSAVILIYYYRFARQRAIRRAQSEGLGV
ncbi:MAG: MATE family efflux transporter [Oscillospiraceae bacterium]|nr:MATE family efflux transporter [Oscillospiraceae bacterium]